MKENYPTNINKIVGSEFLRSNSRIEEVIQAAFLEGALFHEDKEEIKKGLLKIYDSKYKERIKKIGEDIPAVKKLAERIEFYR